MASSQGVVVVTGAAGFIGSHVCGALIAQGRAVLGVDSFDAFYPRAVKERNLREMMRAAGTSGSFWLLEADVASEDFTERLAGAVGRVGAVEGVIHLAARAGVRPSIADPAGYAIANVVGTQRVLDAARELGAGRVVAASSSSVYGNNAKVPFAETDGVDTPISPYASTKKSCELIGHAHHHLTGMAVGMLRFFTVYGPRQRPDLAISLFLKAVARGERVRMFGDGTTSRDYTFIEDIVGGVLAAYERVGGQGYRVWNLGSDRPVALAELIAEVGRTVGREPVVERAPMQAGDVERTWADLGRARAELGYSPRVTLAEGLARQWAWMQRVEAS